MGGGQSSPANMGGSAAPPRTTLGPRRRSLDPGAALAEQEGLASSTFALSNKKARVSTGEVGVVDPESTPQGFTMQAYEKYIDAMDALRKARNEKRKLEGYLDQILTKCQQKAPAIRAQRVEYDKIKKAYSRQEEKLSAVRREVGELKEHSDVAQREAREARQESSLTQHTVNDLSRQVILLMNQPSGVTGAAPLMITRPVLSAAVQAGAAADDRPVEFNNVTELLANNVRLLSQVNELRMNLANREAECREAVQQELQQQIQEATTSMTSLKAEREKQTKMLQDIVRQRDMYVILLCL
jgi:nucleoprotein TPR